MNNCPQLRLQKAHIKELKAQLVQKDEVGQRLQNEVVALRSNHIKVAVAPTKILRDTLQLREAEIAELKAQLEQKDVVGQRLQNQVLDLKNEIDALLRQKSMGRSSKEDAKISKLAAQLVDRDDKIAELEKHSHIRAEAFRALLSCSAEKDAIIETSGNRIRKLEASVEGWQYASDINNSTLSSAKQCIKARDSEILTLTGEIHSLKTQIAAKKTPKIVVKCYHVGGAIGCSLVREKNKQLAKLEAKLSDANAARKAANVAAEKSRKNFDLISKQLRSDRNVSIAELRKNLAEYFEQITHSAAMIQGLRTENKALKKKINLIYCYSITDREGLVREINQLQDEAQNLPCKSN